MKYFVDTSYLIAVTHKKDQYHSQAVGLIKSLEKPIHIITTEAILMEYGNMLSQINVRERAFNYIKLLKEDKNTDIISIDSELFEKGLTLFGKYKDKEWGLVDCISFTVMREKDIFCALTSDEHFSQAGFSILMSTKQC